LSDGKLNFTILYSQKFRVTVVSISFSCVQLIKYDNFLSCLNIGCDLLNRYCGNKGVKITNSDCRHPWLTFDVGLQS